MIFTVLDPAVLAIISVSPSFDAVGATIMIMGQNFGETASDNMVTFLGDESDTPTTTKKQRYCNTSTATRLRNSSTYESSDRSNRW